MTYLRGENVWFGLTLFIVTGEVFVTGEVLNRF